MIHLEFSPIRALPSKALASSKEISQRFLDVGAQNLEQAADFLVKVPYGYNSSYKDPLILLDEGKGTCGSKHNLFAKLAAENGVLIERYDGIYPMNAELSPAAATVLEKYGLAYVPMIHCFLRWEGLNFDLTEGNCNGKSGLIVDYFDIWSRSNKDVNSGSRFKSFMQEACSTGGDFAQVGVQRLREINHEIEGQLKAVCQRNPVMPLSTGKA